MTSILKSDEIEIENLKDQLQSGEIFLINKHMCVYPEDVEFWTSNWLSKIEIIEAAYQDQGPLITRLLWKKS
jgi:hypothetical protein